MHQFNLSFSNHSQAIQQAPYFSIEELLSDLEQLHNYNPDCFWRVVYINEAYIVDFLIALYLITLDYGLYVLNEYLLRNKWIGNVGTITPVQKQEDSVKEAYAKLEEFGLSAYPYEIN